MIDHLIDWIFGDAVSARIRSTPSLLIAFGTSFLYALVSAIVGQLLVGLPFRYTFLAVLLLFAERVGQVYFSEEHQLYSKLKEIRTQVRLTFIVFVGMTFFVGQALKLYPADLYAAIVRYHGLVGLFWARDVPIDVSREIALLSVLSYLSYSAVIRRSRLSKLILIAMAVAAVIRIALRW